jgi:hypothetical protein
MTDSKRFEIVDKLDDLKDRYIAKGESPALIDFLEQLTYSYHRISNDAECKCKDKPLEEPEIGRVITHKGRTYKSFDY